MKPDGSGARKIAEGVAVGPLSPPRYNLDALWSHDGSVVHIMTGCTPKLSDVPVAGGAAVPKAAMTDHDAGFLWSPNDSQIVYWHFTGADVICEQNGFTMASNLMVMNANGSGKKVVRPNIPWGFRVESWMAGGTALFAWNNGPWVKVAMANGAVTPIGLNTSLAKLSPNGLRVAYWSGGHVYVRLTSGGIAKDLGAGSSFAWRPNSSSVAVCGGTLRVVNVSTGVGATVYPFATLKPTWSPDGQRIAFVKSSGGIFVVGAGGGTVTPVPGASTAGDVQWQP